MATKNTKDVELNISTTTSGTEQLQQLSKQLRSMADSAGDAAPEFEQLALQVDRLAEQSTALRKFEEISAAVNETGDALSKAKARVEELGNELQTKKAAFDSFSQGQTEARAEVKRLEDALAAAKTGFARYKEDATAAERATVGYKATVEETRKNIRALEDALTQQKGLVAKKSEVNALESEIRKLSTAYDRAKTNVDKIESSLAKQNAAVDAAKSGLGQLGVAADTVTAAQQAVADSAAKTTKAIAAEKSAFDYLEAAAREAAAAERDLAEVNALEKKRQQAIQLQKASEYVNFWTDALNKAEAAERQLAEESKRAAAALQNAFSATGIRSAETIRAEIVRINDSLRVLATNSKVSGAEFDRAFASAKERVAALERELKGLPTQLREANTLTGALRQGISQLTAAYGAFEIGRGFVNSINQFETLRRSLTIISGSTETAGRQIEFLKDIADRVGLSVGALSQDFVNFSASAQTSGISLERQREVFEAVANSAGQLGISTDRVGLILQALAQTANKGKVTLEELQGQLGESLPGALSIVSDGLGVTKERLLELVKAGIDSDTFFDAFVRGSRNIQGTTERVETLRAAVSRVSNAFFEFSSEAADTTAMKSVVGALDALADNFGKVANAAALAGQAFAAFRITKYIESFTSLSASLRKSTFEQEAAAVATKAATVAKTTDTAVTQGQTAATTANTAATHANTAAVTANKLAWGTLESVKIGVGNASVDAAKKVGVLSSAFTAIGGAARSVIGLVGGLPGVLALVALNARELGTAIGEGAADLLGWGKRLRESEAQLKAQADAEGRAADEAKRLADEQRKAQQAALGLNGESAKIVDTFDTTQKKAKNVAEAIEALKKELRFDDLSGIKAAGVALNALGETGKLSAQQIRDAYAGALNGKDLLVFETNARAAFDGVRGGAEQLKIVIDAIGEESLRRAGTSALELETGFSSAMNSAINDTDALVKAIGNLGVASERTGAVIAKSIGKEIDLAKTRDAIDATIVRIRDLGESGKLTGLQFEQSMKKAIEKAIELAETSTDIKKVDDILKEIVRTNPELATSFASAADQIKSKTAELTPALRQLQADAKALGVEIGSGTQKSVEQAMLSYERLKASGKLSTDQLRAAFINLAKQATDAAGGVVPEWVKVEAGLRNVSLQSIETGKSFSNLKEGAIKDFQQIQDEVNKTIESLFKLQEVNNQTAEESDAAMRKRMNIDKSGMSLDSSGNVLTVAGRQLTSPGPGYEFVNDASYEALQKAGSYQNYVPGVGYWKKTSSTSSGGNAFGGVASGARSNKTVNVNLSLGGKTVPLQSSAESADQLLKMLTDAQRAAGAT